MAIAVVLLIHPKKRAVVKKLYHHGAHFKAVIQIFLGIFGVLMYLWPGWSKKGWAGPRLGLIYSGSVGESGWER